MRLAFAIGLGILCATPALADSLPMDAPISIDGLETVCTGIGGTRDDPRWLAYPVRIEFSNSAAQYLAGAHVTLSDAKGKLLADVDCAGTWLLFKLDPGTYVVRASLTGQSATKPRSTTFKLTGREAKQKRIVLQFSDIAPNR